jgi:hypothetical protein
MARDFLSFARFLGFRIRISQVTTKIAEENFKLGSFPRRTFRSIDAAIKRLIIVPQRKNFIVPQIRKG